MSRVPLATAGAAPVAHVDESGYAWLPDGARLEWWVLGDDGWHVPAASATLRQRALENSPVVETTIRVPGGDVAWRVGAAVTGNGTVIVAECENRGSIPVAVGVGRVEGTRVVALDEHPIAHTITWRGAIGPSSGTALPPLDTVGRGWAALAKRGSEIVTNDPAIDDALTAARMSVLLHHGELLAGGKRADRDVAAAVATALTLLDYEDEAGALRRAAKLKPARKGLPVVADAAVAPIAVGGNALGLLADPLLAAQTVMAIRNLVARDTATVDCLPAFTPSWRGRSVDVANLPTAAGLLSFAVRWHGNKPALLWELDGEKSATITARSLDPDWSTKERSGEVLLATRLA